MRRSVMGLPPLTLTVYVWNRSKLPTVIAAMDATIIGVLRMGVGYVPNLN